MHKRDLEERTMTFALKIIAFAATLPWSKAGAIIEYQLVKAGTSVGANYREANRAESRPDFIHKKQLSRKSAPRVAIGLNFAIKLVLETLSGAVGF